MSDEPTIDPSVSVPEPEPVTAEATPDLAPVQVAPPVEPIAPVVEPPVAVAPPAPVPMDAAQLGRAIADGVTQGLRSQPQPSQDRQLGRTKFTMEQLIEAKYDDNVDKGVKIAIEREMETRRQEALTATRQDSASSSAAVARIQGQIFQEYPAMMDQTSPLFQAVNAMSREDATVASSPQAILRAVKAAAHDLGISPASKMKTPAQAAQQTVEQIQKAAAAAAISKGSGAGVVTAPVDINAMSDAEFEHYVQQQKFGSTA